MIGCAPGNGAAVAEQEKDSAKKKYPANKLAKESSPYLLLHAHNPVRWYPWGPEAFAKAKKENKPIFLSIGYSSCFWCHVMERKVFMNEALAKYMNAHFVNIKVDREERPDLDDIYMTALHTYLQAVGSRQGGGWPLSMFLTPEGKPFAGGTYFPPKEEHGRPGFDKVLKRIHELWTTKEKGLRSNADQLTGWVRDAMKPRPALATVKLDRTLVGEITRALVDSRDPEYGGLGYRRGARNPSKFPVPCKLALLQHAAVKSGDKAAAKTLYHTLDRIAAGGIHDHLGGGFHRYSTDRYWHVPHFEKMLYDQAQLAEVYVDAYRQTGKAAYKEAVEGTLRFVLRKMTDPAGGFYSALDAETDGTEGEYYVWTKAEIGKVLGAKDAKLFGRVYGLEAEKRFEHGYVLHLPRPLSEVAKRRKVPLPELKRRLAIMRGKLLAARQKRKPLLRDDKVLTSWNGLMIRAFAHAGQVLKEPKYVKVAEKAAKFILVNLRDDKKRLKRTWRKGTAKLNAYVDDYAFLVAGLLALHDATGDDKWLNAAQSLTDDQIRDYWSKVGGGFFFTPRYHEELIVRTRPAYDAVEPSGNSVSIRNLIQLAKRTGKSKYRKYAADAINAFAPNLERSPLGTAHLALAIAEFLDVAPKTKGKEGAKPPAKKTTGRR
ncbi:MAG: thioredoxin domain-containing protein [Planctomycetaceae bacterium]